MQRYRVWLLALALSLAIAVPASAWEFTMDGAFTWEFDYRTQGGGSGFFGPYDMDAGSGIAGTTTGFFAPLNGWLGEHAGGINGGLVSGSDSSWNVFYMSTNMDLRINPAVRVRGNYYIGEWAPITGFDGTPNVDFGTGNLVASQALNSRWGGIQRSFSPGYWNMLWLTAELPWGIVTLGKRKSTFGMGMYNNGEENRSSESFSLTVPYGPLRLAMSFYPSRRGAGNSNYPTVAAGFAPGSTAGYYNQDFDKNNTRWWDATIAQFTYRNGPLEIGAYANPLRFSNGGEGIIGTAETRRTATYLERTEAYGVAYLKYNNGRFFFNAELDWDHATIRNRKKAAGGGSATNGINAFGQTLFINDNYVENWRAAAEGGVMCGPAKLALISAWAAGPDRRAGRQIDRTGLVTAAGRAANVRRGSGFANTGLFRPYSLLMVYDYGLGTHINGDTGNGYVEDAMVYGARLDYAVAANLNVYTSFFWADRVSQSGYGWGFIKPVVPAATGTLPAGTVALFHDTTDAGAPSIPDSNLGYEFGAGFDWKLLEGLTVNFSSAYWQPGQWFSWACVDKTIAGWATTPAATTGAANPGLWHINPNKQIDPIYGIELKVTGDF